MSILRVVGFIVAVTLAGCEGKIGERCDGFFQNTCKAPASCVETDDGAWCAGSCTAGQCDPGFECVQVTAGGLAAGGYCLPAAR